MNPCWNYGNLLAFVLLICALTLLVAGCIDGHSANPERLSVDRVLVEGHRVSLHPGDSGAVSVTVRVLEGYHIQANPVPFAYLIPTQLVVPDPKELGIESPRYPQGKPYQLEGSYQVLSVYDGVFDIRLPVHVDRDMPLGDYTTRVVLHYQSCDHRSCFPPDSQAVEVSVHITE